MRRAPGDALKTFIPAANGPFSWLLQSSRNPSLALNRSNGWFVSVQTARARVTHSYSAGCIRSFFSGNHALLFFRPDLFQCFSKYFE
jgi:hypothetical protein